MKCTRNKCIHLFDSALSQSMKFILFELKEVRLFPLAVSGSGWDPEFETVNHFEKMLQGFCLNEHTHVGKAAGFSCRNEIMHMKKACIL